MEINLNKRSEKQKEFLRQHISPTQVLYNHLDKCDRDLLLNIYEQPLETGHKDFAVSKHQIRFAKGSLRKELDAWVSEKFGEYLGDYVVDRIFGSTSESPTQIHTDSINVETDLPPHKNIMIPLSINGHIDRTSDWDGCQTIYFDQVWLERCGRSLFKHGYRSENLRENIEVYDYSGLDNLTDKQFPSEPYMQYLTHIPYAHCSGLSVETIAQWEPFAPVLFDRNRLHTANNYLINGVTWKRFVCIFTNHAISGN